MSGRIYILIMSCLLGVESFPHRDSPIGIVGGHAINITSAPFMARYYNQGYGFFCGAAIVHKQFIITTGTCYLNFKIFQSYALVGSDKINSAGDAYDIADGYIHPKFTPGYWEYDIALLKLEKPLSFNENVQPILLAEKDFVVPKDATFDTMGFGSLSANIFDLKFPKQLQKVTLRQITQETCKARFPPVTDTMICAGEEWKGTCYYDEGAPLVNSDKLVGVLIYAGGCGLKDNPSIYTFVPPLRDFIDNMIKNNE